MRISLLTFATMLVLAGTCQAQEPGGPPGGGFNPEQVLDRIFQNDNNDDGKIDKDEADERMVESFDRIDADEDGFVTRDEMKKMLEQRPPGGGPEGRRGGPDGSGGPEGPEMRGGGPGGPGGGGPGGFGGGPDGPAGPGGGRRGGPGRMMAMMPIIQALDVDKNGELSMEEIDNAIAAIRTLDKDKDGSISAEEMAPDMSQGFGGGGPGGPGGGMGRGGRTGPAKRPTFDEKDKK